MIFFHINSIISHSKTRNLALENEELIISSIYYTLINRLMRLCVCSV